MRLGQETPDPDPRVCYCMRVSRRQIDAAIAAGAATLEALQARTRAGTGCGTCRFELLAILAAAAARRTSR